MELTQSYTLPVPPQRAWEALTDAEVLRTAIPGCEQIRADGEDAFTFAVNLSVDGVRARFSGHLRMLDTDPPHTCTLRFESDAGSEAGAVGNARVHLDADGDASTTLSYQAESQANGSAGGLRKLADEFGKRFAACVAGDGFGVVGDAPLPSDPSVQHAAVAESAPAGKGAKCWKAWTTGS
ncbi:carbon monoxide dehydrogenase [Trinickia symbiotica]|uniref:Carbon monoxide dehydrogenase n=1 Tax=Trinickia symbiotica TaxID=863227 RepID=A0A2T3XNF0_9BURK|nr:SRPBCC domain-containing protein [Trinickia symbiotica]PTB18020.1 carbon monoxide dehydrogenase [Trinickia symbiotica]